MSPTTVSLVLSGKGHIGAETRARVLQIAKSLGHRPAISTREAIYFIAFIEIEGVRSEFYMPVIHRAIKRLKAGGYPVILDVCEDSPQDEAAREEHIRRIASQATAVLLLLHWQVRIDNLYVLFDNRTPFILFNQTIPGFQRNYITLDHYQGACEAMEHLIGLGHRRIAHIKGQDGQPHAKLRYCAYRDSLSAHGIKLDEQLVVNGTYAQRSGYEGMTKLLSLRERPTAVFVANDVMASGALAYARERGLRVPDEISIVGFDDTAESQVSHPTITTVRQLLQQLGEEGARMMLHLLREGRLFTPPESLRAQLIVRKSTGPPVG